MSALRPKLRRSITGHPDPNHDDFVWLYDALRLTRQTVRLHRDVLTVLQHFDGRSSLLDIQAGFMNAGLGLLPSSVLDKIVSTLDEALFLEGTRYDHHLQRFLADPVRAASCVGVYDGEASKLREQLDQLFTAPGGPGLPDLQALPDDTLRGALIPHIDYERGNVTYGWGFKEVIEHTDADVFVILGTSHFSPHRYILTRKDFATPLGIVPTDRAYVDRLAAGYGETAFDDEVAHVPEHSIELHVVVLQHLMQQRRKDFRIVPVLVGSFQDAIAQGREPETLADIARMVQALRDAESACHQKVCYLLSGDLAHIGPKFGDGEPVTQDQQLLSRRQDEAILHCLEQVDRTGLFSILFEEQDARRICGFSPVYTFLAAIGAASARRLHYQQYVEPQGFESVSFASVAFYR